MHTMNEDVTTRRMQGDASFGAGAAAMRALLTEVQEPEDPYIADLERSLSEVTAALEHELTGQCDDVVGDTPRHDAIHLEWEYVHRARKLLDGDGQ